jgi:homogentisate 1,2-dioxygenase
MLPHGPDTEAFEKASAAILKPHKLEGTMAFMFESRHAQRVTAFAAAAPQLQDGYQDCWAHLAKHFDSTQP